MLLMAGFALLGFGVKDYMLGRMSLFCGGMAKEASFVVLIASFCTF